MGQADESIVAEVEAVRVARILRVLADDVETGKYGVAEIDGYAVADRLFQETVISAVDL